MSVCAFILYAFKFDWSRLLYFFNYGFQISNDLLLQRFVRGARIYSYSYICAHIYCYRKANIRSEVKTV